MNEKSRWRRVLQWTWRSLLAAAALYLACAVPGCINPSMPFDAVLSTGSAPVHEDLQVADDGEERLVVLVHGLWRSKWAMALLERGLRAHGYRVLNRSYASSAAYLEDHAKELSQWLEDDAAEHGAPDRLYFVAHSMGGLVVQEHLRRGGRVPEASVFLGTPHRGAQLTDKRRDWWLFQLFLGDKAAAQLSPEDAFHRQPLPAMGRVGTIVGGKGDGEGWNEDIEGDDDGTVAVVEAHCPGEADSVQLAVGHTGLTISRQAVLEVLRFLKRGRFGE